MNKEILELTKEIKALSVELGLKKDEKKKLVLKEMDTEEYRGKCFLIIYDVNGNEHKLYFKVDKVLKEDGLLMGTKVANWDFRGETSYTIDNFATVSVTDNLVEITEEEFNKNLNETFNVIKKSC